MDLELIKKLRATTGAGMMAAKNALVEAGGDLDKAAEILRKSGATSAAKRAEREARAGVIEAYVHGGRIGVLLELNCETDFVQRTDDFQNLARELAMQVAAAAPEFVSPEDVPAERVATERAIYTEEAAGKPEEVITKIIDGKLDKYYETICLVRQPFIKDPDKTVGDLITEVVAKVGENIVVRRFTRFELGQVD